MNSKHNQYRSNASNTKTIYVQTLFIGGGPATLGILSNAY